MMAKSMRSFIREHRTEIDAVIRKEVPGIDRINDNERRLWVLNREELYLLARAAGVDETPTE